MKKEPLSRSQLCSPTYFLSYVFLCKWVISLIIFFIINSHWQHRALWLLLSLSSIASGRSSTLHSVSAKSWCNSLLVSQHYHVLVLEFIKEHCFWVPTYFSSSIPHVLFILLEWFVRWEAGGHIAAVLLGFISRICSRQCRAFVCCSHLVASIR